MKMAVERDINAFLTTISLIKLNKNYSSFSDIVESKSKLLKFQYINNQKNIIDSVIA